MRKWNGDSVGRVACGRTQWLVLAILVTAAMAAADVKLPALISDNMVLQQGRQVAIWGWADPGEQVSVSLGDQKGSATADSNGQWKVQLGPLTKGGPLEMTVAGKNTITIHNVLVGEVWVASGQSNMEFAVSNKGVFGGALDFEKDLAEAANPQLRLFLVKRAVAGKPQADVQGQWVVAGPDTVGTFSAVAYYFGRDLQADMKFPVGMIASSWGGTPAEAWTSAESLDADPELKVVDDAWRQKIAEFPHVLEDYHQKMRDWVTAADDAEANGKVAIPMPDGPPKDARSHPWRDAGLWNGMMAPISPYGIAGAIWYQGESNAEFAYQYRKVFSNMITQWRSSWGEGDFPFLFVQLANYEPAGMAPDQWAVLRESQVKALALPKTGMAMAIDIGNPHNIHPTNKQEVGRRLALNAEGIAYDQKVEYMGPLYKSLAASGKGLRLQFSDTSGALAMHGSRLEGFEVAGDDKTFYPATARISGMTVIVSSPKVSKPVAARYAWANDPTCNLYDKAGLPASPFRTDDWTVVTQGKVRTDTVKLW